MTEKVVQGLFSVCADELLDGLLRQGYSQEQADAIVHALVDIADSTEKIYRTLLPELMRVMNRSAEEFKDKLWDIREEFRHVEYHMGDAKLTDL